MDARLRLDEPSGPAISPRHDLRAALAERALAEIPLLLTLQDRTPLSPTHGCFDRDYWHTRVADFPSGMYQKLVMPLALVWSLDLPGNVYKGQPHVRDSAEAGIRFAARSAHADGACDDYYPNERAAGAAAFSLLACLDASEILGLRGDAEIDAFLKRRATWLALHEESGRLSNHEALICACLQRMVERFGADWQAPLERRLERLLSWQNAEGWFDEYGGADPGYLTLTIAQLADLDRRRPDPRVRGACAAAIRFLHTMVHPDGSLGGEYTSRATSNYFPHGLEIAGAWDSLAPAINDRCLVPLAEGRQPAFSERFVGHHVSSWLLAWREWRSERPGPVPLAEGRVIHRDARLLVDQRDGQRLYLGWSRGGAFRLFEGNTLLLADTGPALGTSDGRVIVTHLEGDNRVALAERRITVEGTMAYAGTALLTPFRSIVLRLIMITAGRFFPDLIRRTLQRLLVTGRRSAPFRFHRTLDWDGAAWTVRDEIIPDHGWGKVDRAGIGGFQSSLTTVVSRLWQPDQLQPWIDLTPCLELLDDTDPLVVERRIDSAESPTCS